MEKHHNDSGAEQWTGMLTRCHKMTSARAESTYVCLIIWYFGIFYIYYEQVTFYVTDIQKSTIGPLYHTGSWCFLGPNVWNIHKDHAYISYTQGGIFIKEIMWWENRWGRWSGNKKQPTNLMPSVLNLRHQIWTDTACLYQTSSFLTQQLNLPDVFNQ